MALLRCPDEFALGVVAGVGLVIVAAPVFAWTLLRVCRPCRERLRVSLAQSATRSVLAQREVLRRMARRESPAGPYTLLASAVDGAAIPAIELATGRTIGSIIYRDLALPATGDALESLGLPVP